MHLGLQARLNAGAEDAEDAIAAAEFAGDQRGNGGGAHVGEMSGVGQEGHGFAGFGRGEQHHAVAHRQAAREVAGKGGGDLEREIFAAAAVAGFHVNFGVIGRDVEVHGHRHVALAAGLGGDRVAHAVDDLSRTRATRRISGKFKNPHQDRVSRKGAEFAKRGYVLKASSISTWYPLARRLVSLAMPTTAISSANMASVMPALRAAAVCDAMQ